MVGVANDGQQAIDEALRLKPDVVLMDVRMPKMDGIEATRAIAANPLLKDTHVLVLTTFDFDQYAFDALSANASGFLLKDADPDDIAAAINIVALGGAIVQPSVMKRLAGAFANAGMVASTQAMSYADKESEERIESLTEREREILKLVAKGFGNDAISEELVISPATVKTHIARIMQKTNTHDRAQLVVFAYESGFVVPSV